MSGEKCGNDFALIMSSTLIVTYQYIIIHTKYNEKTNNTFIRMLMFSVFNFAN